MKSLSKDFIQIFHSGQLILSPNKEASQSLLFHVPHHMYKHEFLLYITFQHPNQTIIVGKAHQGCRNNRLLLSFGSGSCGRRARGQRLEILE